MTNACCIKQTIVQGGCQAAEGGSWGDNAASFGVFGHLCGRPPACTPSSPCSACTGRRSGPSGFRGFLGSKGTQMPGQLVSVELIMTHDIVYLNRL